MADKRDVNMKGDVMRSKQLKWVVLGLVVLVGMLSVGQTYGGSLVPTAAPGSTMHTVEEIYQQVATIESNLANQALSPATAVVAAGRYAATNLTQVDADLVTGNIKSGVEIFGVSGKAEVVDTTSGDATTNDIVSGKKAWVSGIEVTGTRPVGPVPKTGQTTSYATGDDGDLEPGVTWPGTRFTESNGTVTDHLTGLIWLKNANVPSATRTWATALTDVAQLNTDGTMNGNSAGDTSNGGSHQTDWRLPTVQELQSLIDYGQYSPALPTGHPFTGVQSSYYWSSTTYAGLTSYAWRVYLDRGYVRYYPKGYAHYVWPVRGG